MSATSSALSRTQHRRKQTLRLLGIPILLAVLVNAPDSLGRIYHESVEALGLLLILLCVAGRTLSSLYIAGNKNRRVVDTGPYSMTRNPLYVFSLLGTAGAGLASGSMVLGLAAAGLGFLVFDALIRKEERFLLESFGPAYARYVARVPRWLPNPALWRSEARLSVNWPLVLITARDASLFFLAVPLIESMEMLQDKHLLPVLLHLP